MKKFAFLIFATFSSSAIAAENNSYVQTNFVANKTQYDAAKIEPQMINAWGISIRPAGVGGHFWVTAKNTSYQYVGDVTDSPDSTLRKLRTDSLPYVKLPVGGADNFATGTVFNGSSENFIISQQPTTGALISAPAKFMFASDGGIISAWTERKKPDGSFDRPLEALNVIDQSKNGAQFFGMGISAKYDRLYAADFGKEPAVKVFDGKFQPLPIKFDMPFDDNKNGVVDAGEYAPFNVQDINGDVFVTYAKTQTCPLEEIKKANCKAGELFVGEEDTSKPGQGRLAQFTENGKLIAVWNDAGHLSAPWGLAMAPANFGSVSNNLLVSNFGDGTIAAFDSKTRHFVDVMRDKSGNPIHIEKIWGLVFGNGASLGDMNALYFAAGPNDEKDGIFGSLRLNEK